MGSTPTTVEPGMEKAAKGLRAAIALMDSMLFHMATFTIVVFLGYVIFAGPLPDQSWGTLMALAGAIVGERIGALNNGSRPRRALFGTIGTVLGTLLWIGASIARLWLAINYGWHVPPIPENPV